MLTGWGLINLIGLKFHLASTSVRREKTRPLIREPEALHLCAAARSLQRVQSQGSGGWWAPPPRHGGAWEARMLRPRTGRSTMDSKGFWPGNAWMD